MVFVEYDGMQRPTELEFKFMIIWTRIYDLPVSFMNQQMAEKLGGLFGEVIDTDTDEEGCGWGEYLRFRVKIDITKPVRRGVLLKTPRNPEGEWFDAKYEKLPHLCFTCGLIGHDICACEEEGKRGGQKKKYNEELRAPRGRRNVSTGRHGGRVFTEKAKTQAANSQSASEGEESSNEKGQREDVCCNREESDRRSGKLGEPQSEQALVAVGNNKTPSFLATRDPEVGNAHAVEKAGSVSNNKAHVVRMKVVVRGKGGSGELKGTAQDMEVDVGQGQGLGHGQELGEECNVLQMIENANKENVGREHNIKRKRKDEGFSPLLAITWGKENEGDEEELTGPKQKRKKKISLSLLSQQSDERSARAASRQPRRTP